MKVRLPDPWVKSARNANGVVKIKSTGPFVRLCAVMLVFRLNIISPVPLVFIATAGAATVKTGNETPAGSVSVRAAAPETRRVALLKPPTAPSNVDAIATSPCPSNVPMAPLFEF